MFSVCIGFNVAQYAQVTTHNIPFISNINVVGLLFSLRELIYSYNGFCLCNCSRKVYDAEKAEYMLKKYRFSLTS